MRSHAKILVIAGARLPASLGTSASAAPPWLARYGPLDHHLQVPPLLLPHRTVAGLTARPWPRRAQATGKVLLMPRLLPS
jgi:hypothetical protein